MIKQKEKKKGDFMTQIELNGKGYGKLILEDWLEKKVEDQASPLYFITESTYCQVQLVKVGSPADIQFQIRHGEDGKWESYAVGSKVSLSAGEKLFFRKSEYCGVEDGVFSSGIMSYYRFSIEGGGVECHGNVMSLAYRMFAGQSEMSTSYQFCNLFSNAYWLLTAPCLPAMVLTESCYQEAFYNCTSLSEAPELPAMSLAEGCYRGMFQECDNLAKAPELPATVLAPHCYSSMFRDCTFFEEAPELPAMSLAEGCYESMFYNCCESMKKAPALPATQLAHSCYQYMFSGCTYLEEAPLLPAKQLAYGCYWNMFERCRRLEYIPSFPAGISCAGDDFGYMFKDCERLQLPPGLLEECLLHGHSCYGMFQGCYSLLQPMKVSWSKLDAKYDAFDYMYLSCFSLQSSVPASSSDISALSGNVDGMYGFCRSLKSMSYPDFSKQDVEDWVFELNALGDGWNGLSHVIRFKDSREVVATFQAGEKKWQSGEWKMDYVGEEELGEVSSPLFFQACDAECSVALCCIGSWEPSFQMQFSTDGSSWSSYGIGSAVQLASAGDRVYFRQSGNSGLFSKSDTQYLQFKAESSSGDGKVECHGNVMSLAYENFKHKFTLKSDYQFYQLFKDCHALKSAPCLPADNTTKFCYQGMFQGCDSLLSVPAALPAVEMDGYCCSRMFYGCSSMASAPKLPAMSLGEGCYMNMFLSCKSLSSAPELPATQLSGSCYQSMFAGCTSLLSAPSLQAQSLAPFCYSYMFQGTNVVPELPLVEQLTDNCFAWMFAGTKVSAAPDLPWTELAEYCYAGMFSDCSCLTAAPALPSLSVKNSSYYAMFQNCTALSEAPELPATQLDYTSYNYMFAGCTSLCSAADIPSYSTTGKGTWSFQYYRTPSLNSIEWPSLTIADIDNLVKYEFIFGEDDYSPEGTHYGTHHVITYQNGAKVDVHYEPDAGIWVIDDVVD